MRKLFALLFLLFSFELACAQNYGTHHGDHHIALIPKDSLTLGEHFLKAHWEAHTRTFFMSTINENSLKDDYALASGAGIGLLTRSLYGFQAGVSGFFVYNLTSSKLHVEDSITHLNNRYESGLFDIENLSNKNDLDRLEELYLKYTYSNSFLSIGKINLNTPFFNPQDGRMRPTLEEGIWLAVKENEKIGFNGGYIWEVSPRSTVKWYSVEKSIGIYASGINTNGTKSDYAGNTKSSGMALANVVYKPSKKFRVNIWESYLENIMNTAILEVNSEQNKAAFSLYQGFIYLHQDALRNGGNSDAAKSYIDKNAQSNVISAQFGIKNKTVNTSLNYTHITGDGRYLMPREWGREIFYTFLARERNEGYGNLHALMIKTSVISKNNKIKTSLAYGFYKLPDVRNYRLNKYGMPSYHQVNYEISYQFNHFLKGLELRMLAAYKIKHGEIYNNIRYVYNKVNMLNFNVILDFKI